jgi:hypothetical protein
MSLKNDLIKMLQEEVIFLQQTPLKEKQLINYKYTIKGDLSEVRTF